MGFTGLAVLAGIALGYARGGRLSHIGRQRLRAWPLLAAGITLQVVAGLTGGDAGFALVLVAYAALIAFAVANLWLAAMAVVAVGIAANALVIAVNHGMPVRPAAVVAAGRATAAEVEDLEVGGKRHLERDSDRLTVLADIIPVRPLGLVLSFGDLIIAVGTVDVIAQLMRVRRQRAAPGPVASNSLVG